MAPLVPRAPAATHRSAGAASWRRLARRLVVPFGLLLLALSLMSAGLGGLASSGIAALATEAKDPFLGLLIGVGTTALVQSSSITTSFAVALVGAGLPLSVAVPMVFGANIGTTVTNLVVSLAYLGNQQEFRRAFGAAATHQLFNCLGVALFLPLELASGFLGATSRVLAEALQPLLQTFGAGAHPLRWLMAQLARTVEHWEQRLGWRQPDADLAALLLSVAVFLGAIALFRQLLRSSGNALEHRATRGAGTAPTVALGALTTAVLQSSSATTSLVVPLAGAGRISQREAYHFILGANVGTCVTAFFAALAAQGDHRGAALQLALVHLLFNVFNVVLHLTVPALRTLTLKLGDAVALRASAWRPLGALYILVGYFLLPALAWRLHSLLF